jgi:hypothetical protein
VNLDSKAIEVRISKRVLWVGPSAYPLPNVTQVEPIEFRVKRWRLIKRFTRKCAASIALGFVAMMVLSCASAPTMTLAVVGAGVLAVVGYQVYRLIRGLTLPPLHVLKVQMAGTSRAAVVSRDKPKIDELTYRVVDAIDNPATEYAVWIENINGDIIGGDKLENGDKTNSKTVYQQG